MWYDCPRQSWIFWIRCAAHHLDGPFPHRISAAQSRRGQLRHIGPPAAEYLPSTIVGDDLCVVPFHQAKRNGTQAVPYAHQISAAQSRRGQLRHIGPPSSTKPSADGECRDTRPRVSEIGNLQQNPDGHPRRGVPTRSKMPSRFIGAKRNGTQGAAYKR